MYYEGASRRDSMISAKVGEDDKKIDPNELTTTEAFETTQTHTAENNQYEVESTTHFSRIDYVAPSAPMK